MALHPVALRTLRSVCMTHSGLLTHMLGTRWSHVLSRLVSLSGRAHGAPPGRSEVSGRRGPLPPPSQLPPGPAGSPRQHAAPHRLQGWKPARRHGAVQRQGQPGPAQQGEAVSNLNPLCSGGFSQRVGRKREEN